MIVPMYLSYKQWQQGVGFGFSIIFIFFLDSIPAGKWLFCVSILCLYTWEKVSCCFCTYSEPN